MLVMAEAEAAVLVAVIEIQHEVYQIIIPLNMILWHQYNIMDM